MMTQDKIRCVARVGWFAALLVFVLLGALASVAINYVSSSAIMTFLPVTFLIVGLALGLPRVVRSFFVLGKKLVWWHGLWILVLLSGLVFRVRDVKQITETAVDPWAAYRIALLMVIWFILAARLALRKTAWLSSLFQGLEGTLAIYALICLASTAWSVFPVWTAFKSLEYLAEVAVLAAILATVRSADDYKTLFDLTWILFGLLLASVWANALLLPREALLPGVLPGAIRFSIVGVMPAVSTNTVGELGAILAIVALSRLLLRTGGTLSKAGYRLLFMAGFITLVVSQTRSAIIGFLFGLVLVLFFSRHNVMAFLNLIAALLVPLTSVGDLLWTYFLRGQDPELFRSLSGRLTWWEFGWKKFLEQPSGYGAYAGGRFVVLENFGGVSNMHSSYLEIITGTGILGLLPVLIGLLGTWWVLIRERSNFSFWTLERGLTVEAIGVLAVITTRSFFSVKMVWHPALDFLLVLGYAEFLRRRSKVAQLSGKLPSWRAAILRRT